MEITEINGEIICNDCIEKSYIKCDICLGWFHPECCNIDKNIVHNMKIFYCPNCDKNIEKNTNIIIVINKNQLTNI